MYDAMRVPRQRSGCLQLAEQGLQATVFHAMHFELAVSCI